MRTYTIDECIKYGNIHLSKSTLSNKEPIHTHEFIEIVYVLSGKMTHVIDGESYQVKRGDVLFMNTECTHSFDPNTDYTYVNILFSPRIVQEEDSSAYGIFSFMFLSTFNELCGDTNFGKISFSGKERDDIEKVVFSMLQEYEEKLSSWENVVGNYLNVFITKMLRKVQLGIADEEIDGMWSSLSEYIENNLDSKLSLSLLAQKCFYNPSYFSRLFKEKFGMTLSEYVTRKRLGHAITLLKESDLSIEEISARCGFSDRSSLYHCFSRYLDASPNSYRNKK